MKAFRVEFKGKGIESSDIVICENESEINDMLSHVKNLEVINYIELDFSAVKIHQLSVKSFLNLLDYNQTKER